MILSMWKTFFCLCNYLFDIRLIIYHFHMCSNENAVIPLWITKGTTILTTKHMEAR